GDGGVGPAENLGLQLPGEEANGRDGQREEAGLRATRTCPLGGKGASDQEGGDRDQSRYRQPADDAELPVLRAEQGTEASQCHKGARVRDDLGGGNRAIDAPTLPSPASGRGNSSGYQRGDDLDLDAIGIFEED